MYSNHKNLRLLEIVKSHKAFIVKTVIYKWDRIKTAFTSQNRLAILIEIMIRL